MTPGAQGWTRRWAAAALAVGAAYRLVHYAFHPSLTIDDAMLSVNVAGRSWLGLAHPLGFQQTAPLGFLWALRSAVVLGGADEWALRALPLLAGLALPFAVWRLGAKLLTPAGAALAAAFAALSPILIQYTISVKPYETDALAAAVLALATLSVWERPTAARWALLGGLGALAELCSAPAPFVLAGCALALAIGLGRRGWAALGIVGAGWTALFGVLYLAIARSAATSPYMQWFWDHKFLTPAVLFADPLRAWDILQRLPTQAFTGDAPQVAALFLCWVTAVAGAVLLRRTHGAKLWVLLGPIGAALVASAVRRYPVAPRLFVFAAPLVVVVLAAGVEAAWRRWPAGGNFRAVSALVALWLVILAAMSVNIRRLWAPPTRPLIARLSGLATAEPVYLYAGAVPAWLFYATDWKRGRDTALARQVEATQAWNGHAFHNAPGRGRAVADTEGAGLVFRWGPHPLIVGLSTGISWREGQWLSQMRPDTGWGEREAARIDAVTDSTAWLLFTQTYRREIPTLLRSLEMRQGRVVDSLGSRGAYLYRVRFSRSRP